MTDFQTANYLVIIYEFTGKSMGEDTLFERFIFDLFQMQGRPNAGQITLMPKCLRTLSAFYFRLYSAAF